MTWPEPFNRPLSVEEIAWGKKQGIIPKNARYKWAMFPIPNLEDVRREKERKR